MPKLNDPPKPRKRQPPRRRKTSDSPEPESVPSASTLFPEQPEEPAVDPKPEEAPTGSKPARKKPARKKPARKKPPQKPAAVKQFEPDLSKLQPLEEKQDHLRVVLYGDGGVGKTTSVCSLASRGKLIVVDPENSVRRSALRRMGVRVENISLWPDWSFDGIQQLYVTVKAELERDPDSVFAVSFDTITAMAQFWLEQDVKDALLRPSMQKKHPERTVWDVYKDDYGVLTEQIKSLITRQFYTLPCHVVVVAHTRRGENEDGLIRVGPGISPAAQSALITYSDWVYRMWMAERDSEKVRVLDTTPRGQVEAKDRWGLFDDQVQNQSLLDLLEQWEEPF